MGKDQTFQVKDVCKICNVTRKALLLYEEKGLLTPFYVNEDSGYRYYNAENLSKILHIRRFQSFGFSLDEIYEYLHDTKKLSDVYDRLTRLKEELDEAIRQLRLRMMTEEYDNRAIVRTILPYCRYFVKRAVSHGYMEALEFLRATHLEAIRTDLEDRAPKMVTEILSYEGDYPDVFGPCDMLYCIPMLEAYEGEYLREEAETHALSVFHRGPYTTLSESIKLLMDHCAEKGIRASGPLRLIWLEGPPVHGACEEKYLTQIALPIEEV